MDLNRKREESRTWFYVSGASWHRWKDWIPKVKDRKVSLVAQMVSEKWCGKNLHCYREEPIDGEIVKKADKSGPDPGVNREP